MSGAHSQRQSVAEALGALQAELEASLQRLGTRIEAVRRAHDASASPVPLLARSEPEALARFVGSLYALLAEHAMGKRSTIIGFGAIIRDECHRHGFEDAARVPLPRLTRLEAASLERSPRGSRLGASAYHGPGQRDAVAGNDDAPPVRAGGASTRTSVRNTEYGNDQGS